MSDYRERACFRCGSLLHHEDDCPVCPRCGLRTHRWGDCPVSPDQEATVSPTKTVTFYEDGTIHSAPLLHHKDDCPPRRCEECGDWVGDPDDTTVIQGVIHWPSCPRIPVATDRRKRRPYAPPAVVESVDYVDTTPPELDRINYLPVEMRETEIPTGPESPHDWVRKFDTPSNLDIHLFRDRIGEWKARCSWTTLSGVPITLTLNTEEGLVWDAIKEVGDRLWSMACDTKSITHEFFPQRYR